MDFNSMDEEESTFPVVFTDSNEDYMETCDDEVSDILPRFQRLNIYDEPMELRSEILNEPCFTAETFPGLIDNDEGTSMADSSGKVSPTFISDTSGKIWINEVTKAAIDKEKSLPTTDEQAIPENIQVDSQSQNAVQKTSADVAIYIHTVNRKDEQKLDESGKKKEIGAENVLGEPLNLCLISKLDHICAAEPSCTVSESKTELLSLMAATKETKQIDPEIGERSDTSYTILPERRGSDRIDDDCKGGALGQNDSIVDSDPPKLSYSADVSSDEQSCIDSGVMIDSSPDTYTSCAVNAALVEAKRHRKIANDVSPISQMNRIRQRRFSIFQSPSSNIAETDTSEANAFSDKDSKKSSAIGKASPMNSRRRYRKTKSSPTARLLNPTDVKNDDEKRPSPCKRKSISTENLVGTPGKFRKRSISENNSETVEKTRLEIRSRSLSPSLKVTNPSVEILPFRKSRKRTSSGNQNAGRVKSQKSSDSSDDSENK